LVGVVRGLAVEDQVQAHVELEVVDRPAQLRGPRATGEVNRTRVAGEVLLARLDEPVPGGGGGVAEGEVDVVREQGLGHGRSSLGEGEGDTHRCVYRISDGATVSCT